MADPVEDVVAAVNESLVTESLTGSGLDNDSAVLNGTTARVPASMEGMIVAYGGLFTMALIPIFIGAFRSVRYHREQKVGSTMGFIVDPHPPPKSTTGNLGRPRQI